MAVTKQVSVFQMALTATNSIAALGGVKKLILQCATGDVYIDIDQPTAPTTSFRLFATNVQPVTIELEDGVMNNLHARGVSGAATLYVIAIEG